jgi:hypothetical protein
MVCTLTGEGVQLPTPLPCYVFLWTPNRAIHVGVSTCVGLSMLFRLTLVTRCNHRSILVNVSRGYLQSSRWLLRYVAAHWGVHLLKAVGPQQSGMMPLVFVLKVAHGGFLSLGVHTLCTPWVSQYRDMYVGRQSIVLGATVQLSSW